MLRTPTRALTLAAAMAIALPVTAQEIDLSYRWQAGDTLTYRTTTEGSQDQTAMGQQSKTTSKSEETISIRVLEVNDEGVATIEQTIQTAKVDLALPGDIAVHYDSDDESTSSAASNPQVAPNAALVGTPIVIVIAPDGSIVDLPEYDERLAKAREAAGPAQKQALAGAPGKDTVMSSLEATYKILAGKTVSVGDDWSTEIVEAGQGGPTMTMTFNYSLDSIEEKDADRMANIAMAGKISLDFPAGSPMTFDFSEQSMTGSAAYSEDKGVPTSSSGSMSMVITGGFPGSESPMMTVNLTSKSSMELVSFERGG